MKNNDEENLFDYGDAKIAELEEISTMINYKNALNI